MITGVHTLLYAAEAPAARTFFRDVLGMKFVEAHPGWPIFALPPAELGVHPAEADAGVGSAGSHQLWLMCDDIQVTVEDLKAKGVVFTAPITDQGWGIVTRLQVPGGGEMGLYQPLHALPPRE